MLIGNLESFRETKNAFSSISDIREKADSPRKPSKLEREGGRGGARLLLCRFVSSGCRARLVGAQARLQHEAACQWREALCPVMQ